MGAQVSGAGEPSRGVGELLISRVGVRWLGRTRNVPSIALPRVPWTDQRSGLSGHTSFPPGHPDLLLQLTSDSGIGLGRVQRNATGRSDHPDLLRLNSDGAHRKKHRLATCLRSPICTQRATPARPTPSKHSSACRSEEEHSLHLLLIAHVLVWVKSLHPPVSSYRSFFAPIMAC